MPTIDLQVDNGSRDADCDRNAGVLRPSYEYLIHGCYGIGSPFDTIERFLNVTIPPDSTITSAVLTLTSSGDRDLDTVRLKLSAEAAVNPSMPSSYADFAGRARTTNQVDWDFTTDWYVNVEYSAPDLADVIQEVIDLTGWASGNPLNIFIEDDGSTDDAYRLSRTYENSPTSAAKLSITYTLPLPPPPRHGVVAFANPAVV